jgi:hypothetical protein
LCTVLAGSGCVGRYIRMEEKGLTCVDAQRIAVEAVRRMNYTITDFTKAAPGAPGVIVGSRAVGTNKQGLLVQVFCTTQGAEVEAKSDQGGLAQLDFSSEFRRSFEVAAANRAPPRPAAEHGVDVLMTPERGSRSENLGADVSHIGVLAVAVRITNHTDRIYGFRPSDVRLQTGDGERVKPLAARDVASQLDADAATIVRDKALADRDIASNETLSGFLFFPFKPYTRARVELTDRSTDETEGFAIEF